MHETVFEDGLGDMRDAGRTGHQRHELRLQVGREAREGIGDDIDRSDAGAVALDAHAVVGRRDFRAGAAQRFNCGFEQRHIGIFEHDVAAGHGDGHGIGAGLNAIRQDAVAGAESEVTPSIVIVAVPAPDILAPMAFRQLARSTTSGSRAALPMTVVPRASVAAIIITWVAPTETFGKV